MNILLLTYYYFTAFTAENSLIKKSLIKKRFNSISITISSSKNLKEFYFINWEKNNPLSLCLSMHTSIWD